jgi:hypothetical protein
MYKVKKFVQTSSKPPVSSVACTSLKTGDGKTLTKVISFNVEETKKINIMLLKTGSRFWLPCTW